MPVKTISAHFDTTYNINHNNRKFISSNVDEKRCDNNYTPVMSGHTVNGIYFATIDEIYEKIFESDWRAFQQKQRPVRRYNGTYLEWIREQQQKSVKTAENEKHKNKRQHEAYEIVFQVGNKNDTGYNEFPDDFRKASKLMQETVDHILALPYVVTVTEKELTNPNWKPPENCIVALNCVVHNDEVCPGIHLTIIPYGKSDRGAAHQNLLKRTFENLGYPTKYAEVVNDFNSPIPKVTKSGEFLYDKNNRIVYEKSPVRKGVLDWMDEIKDFTSEKMKEEFNWDRSDRIGGHNHLSVLNYKISQRKTELEKIESEIADKQEQITAYQTNMLNNLIEGHDIYETAFTKYQTDLWNDYRNTSNEFWDWYKKEKIRIENEIERTKNNKNENEYIRLKAEYYGNLYRKSGNLIFAIAAVIMRIFKHFKYDEYIENLNQLLASQTALHKFSKNMSSAFANARKELKTDTASKVFIDKLAMIENNLKQDYYNKLPEYLQSYEILNGD